MSQAPLLVRESAQGAGRLPRPGVPRLLPQPRPEWVVGVCPLCGGPLVHNSYYLGGHGLIYIEECWGALSFPAECAHRRRL
jgi:hypothetical protein